MLLIPAIDLRNGRCVRLFQGDFGAETRYENLPLAFHQRVKAGFLEIAKREPKRCAVIDAAQDIDTLAATIARTVSDRLGV